MIRNSTSDSINESIDNNSYNSSSNTAADKDEHNDSLEKDVGVLSPNTKINIVKQKYLPT